MSIWHKPAQETAIFKNALNKIDFLTLKNTIIVFLF